MATREENKIPMMIGALATGINLNQARNKALEMIDLVDLIDKRHP